MTKDLDDIQKKLIDKKFSKFFELVNDVYHSPKSTKRLVNQLIAIDIAYIYNSKADYIYKSREEISYNLNEIHFTSFFVNNKGTTDTGKVFFMFKNPEKHIKTDNVSKNEFVKFVFKKYCKILSSKKLYEIFRKDINASQTSTQKLLKDVIYTIASNRSNLINRIASIFEVRKNKDEINTAHKLKKAIEKVKFQDLQNNNKYQNDMFILNLVKSACPSS